MMPSPRRRVAAQAARYGLAALVWLGPAAVLAAGTSGAAGWTLELIAGTGEPGYGGDGGPAVLAQLDGPQALARGPGGEIFVADTGNHRVRKISPAGIIVTVAGTGEPGRDGDGGPATEAKLDRPSRIAVAANGDVYVVDGERDRVRRIDGRDGTISTIQSNPAMRYVVGGGQRGTMLLSAEPKERWRMPGATPALVTFGGPQGFTVAPSEGLRAFERIDRLTAGRLGVGVFAWRGFSSRYGVTSARGREYFSYDADCYTVGQPRDIAMATDGTLFFTAGMFAGKRHVFEQRGRRRFGSIAGGGIGRPASGARAEAVDLAAAAVAVASPRLLYVVHEPGQIFALHRERRRPGVIVGWTRPRTEFDRTHTADIAVYAVSEDSRWYVRPDTNGRFLFRDLPPGQYRVYAHFGEEGVSCDAADCGFPDPWTHCPGPPNDPVVRLTAERPVGRVYLQLQRFWCWG